MLRSHFLCSLASSNEPHIVVMRVGGRAGEGDEGRGSKTCVGLTLTGHGTPHQGRGFLLLLSQPKHTAPAWTPVLSSQGDFSCYLLLEAWKSWLTRYSSPSSKHTFAQLFSNLLHFCATFMNLLRDFPVICKAWVHLGAVGGDRKPEVQRM